MGGFLGCKHSRGSEAGIESCTGDELGCGSGRKECLGIGLERRRWICFGAWLLAVDIEDGSLTNGGVKFFFGDMIHYVILCTGCESLKDAVVMLISML